MRCPKCQYISFDSGDRCRNCGYEFSLAFDPKELDLPIQGDAEPLGPMADLALADVERDSSGSDPARAARSDHASASVSSDTDGPRPDAPALDLPLFNGPGAHDRPLVTPPAVPRPPLAVRRATAPVVRPKARAAGRDERPGLDLGQPAEAPSAFPGVDELQDADARAAPFGRRVLAGAIDVAILGAIDLAVLYFTLRLCGLQLSEARLVPVVPFGAFVMLLDGGYLVAFTTAAGQTIGKMAARIRVIPSLVEEGAAERVPFAFAALRAAAYLISVLPAGLGFIPALLGADHRALHDRLSDTRVVRA